MFHLSIRSNGANHWALLAFCSAHACREPVLYPQRPVVRARRGLDSARRSLAILFSVFHLWAMGGWGLVFETPDRGPGHRGLEDETLATPDQEHSKEKRFRESAGRGQNPRHNPLFFECLRRAIGDHPPHSA